MPLCVDYIVLQCEIDKILQYEMVNFNWANTKLYNYITLGSEHGMTRWTFRHSSVDTLLSIVDNKKKTNETKLSE